MSLEVPARQTSVTGESHQPSCDFLIVGAGITGLTVARELIRRGAEGIVIVDKEPELGAHASGRNSGVLHAGIYYSGDSLKARFCADGNRRMKEFCRDKGVPVLDTGKTVVATNEEELAGLYELERRAADCSAQVTMIDETELHRYEPHARTHKLALHSPDTASVDPKAVLHALRQELESGGRAVIKLGVGFHGREGTSTAVTGEGSLRFKTLINAAGSYSDKIAHRFGCAEEYKILPFKGTYKRLKDSRAYLVNGHIYPVPDLRNPFLGVHLSRTADNHVYIGPTAIPAFGRENYKGLHGVSREFFSILYREGVLFATNPGFRNAAVTEPRKYSEKVVIREAQRLVPSLQKGDLEKSDKVGIRAQLVHWPTRQLVMDYLVQKEENSLHVLNAVSPAFTSSMAFAEHVVDTLEGEGI